MAEGLLLTGSFIFSLWPILLYTITLVETPWPATLRETVWYLRPGEASLLTTLLSEDGQVACVPLEGLDLPLIIPLSALPYHLADNREQCYVLGSRICCCP